MRLVCSTDIAISDGTFDSFVLAPAYYLYSNAYYKASYEFLRQAVDSEIWPVNAARHIHCL